MDEKQKQIKHVKFNLDKLDHQEQVQEEDEQESSRVIMKRYFSNLVDLYPVDCANFIKARENAKRKRMEHVEADKLLTEMSEILFDVDNEEPIMANIFMNSIQSSFQASPAKE